MIYLLQKYFRIAFVLSLSNLFRFPSSKLLGIITKHLENKLFENHLNRFCGILITSYIHIILVVKDFRSVNK